MYVTNQLGLGSFFFQVSCLGGNWMVMHGHRDLDDFDQGAEGGGIADRHFAQDLAIEFDFRGLEAVDELAIAQTVHLRSGAQADNPQAAEVALAAAAIAKRIHASANQSFLGCAEQLATATAKAL